MSYLVLARKYRPQSFEDLIGQEHVAKTLANAIAQDRVAHAFLFTGVRGVGKTTSARILAKCLNCLGADGKAKGPTSKPCQQCAACTEIAAGVDMDVQEIDAASYNGVDEVRRLQEGLAFRPARDRFKIYIVDEVHMLSNAAWNAFLKTLEEPPPHVKFIFATTEVHKVPVTILSRCQRYDFKLVGARPIAARLRDVLALEKIEAEESAISVLAREAAGSMRDAMSLLDQVIAYGGQKVTSEDVTRVLGVADRAVMNDLTGAILAGDAGKALSVLDAVARQGFDLVHLCRDLLRHVRNLVVGRVCDESQARELLDLADEEVADVLKLAKESDPDDLGRIFTALSKAFDEIVKSGQVRSVLEMTIVRLARRPPLLPLDELLVRLGELEKRLATGAPPPARGGGGGGGRAAQPQASITSERGDVISSRAVSIEPPVMRFEGPEPSRIVVTAPAIASSRHEPATAFATTAAPATAPASATSGSLALAPVAVPVAVPAATPIVAPESELVTTWRAILDRVRKAAPQVAASLDLAVPQVVTRERLVVAFEDDSFEDARAEQTDAKTLLTEHARAFFSAPTQVTFEVAARGSKIASVAYLDAAKKKQMQIEARAAVEKHELVQKAIKIFDADLKDIKLPAQED